MQQVEFQTRRKQFLASLAPQSIAILPTANEFRRTYDTHFPYRPNSDFYYLTGFPEPEAIAVLIKGIDSHQYILFNRVCDPIKEIWEGKRSGQVGACENYGADKAYPISEFSQQLPQLMQGNHHLYYAVGRHDGFDNLIQQALNKLAQQVRSGITVPSCIENIETILHDMRLRKSPAEIAVMRKAAEISSQAHIRLMQQCKPGLYEYQLEAELLYEFYKNGSRFPAYNSIVASGANSCTLHYSDNNACLRDGDVLLVDAACELDNYASDITRTIPVNGQFTREQQAVYETVLAVQVAMVDWVKPGVVFEDGMQQSIKLTTQGLKDLGLLTGTVDGLIESGAYRQFYMHRLSHWIGMDVHDVGSYKKDGQWRQLEPGMVLTIEPGIYISPSKEISEKWWNIGVRIEDDVAVTNSGHEVLSKNAPKSVAEIHKIMKG